MKKTRFIQTGRRMSTLDKIRAHYIEGSKLSEIHEQKRMQYEQANAYRVQGYSKDQTVQILSELKVVTSRSSAYLVVKEAEELFGDITKSNKDGLRHILTENFMANYRKAKNAGNIKEMNRALENVAKVNGLFTEENAPVDWSKVLIPVPVFTTDPEVLKKQEVEDATEFTVS